MNNSAGKALVKSPGLRKSQQKAKEIYEMYFMHLRSGLVIEKKACYFRKETAKRHSPETVGNHKEPHLLFTTFPKHLEYLEQFVEAFPFHMPMVQKDTRTFDGSSVLEYSFSLSTYSSQSITFGFADESYEIYVEDLREKQEKDKVLLCFYVLHLPATEIGDCVDCHKLMVSLSLTKDKDFLLHANNKEHSVKLKKCENSSPDQIFFFLHTELQPSSCVSFECKSNPGVFIGIKDNHVALIKNPTEHSRRENIKFKLS